MGLKKYQHDNLKAMLSLENFNTEPLFLSSRDGFTSNVLHQKIDNKGPTITLLKILGNDDIVVGVN